MITTKANINRWIRELRSGEYKQTHGALQDAKGFCCLGVACDIFTPARALIRDDAGHIFGGMPATQPYTPIWIVELCMDFEKLIGVNLPTLNDDDDFTFDEIADLLQAIYILEVL